MRARGVTLLEQVLVLGLMALVLWTARPVLSGVLLRWRLGSGLHQVRMVLLEAQAREMADGKSRRVDFAPGSGRLAVEVLRNGAWAAEQTLDLPGEVQVQDTSFAQHRMAFSGLGAPDAGGEVVLRAGTRTGRVRVEPTTGMVRCLP